MVTHQLIVGTSERMDEFEDESIALVTTSPPYGHFVRDYADGEEKLLCDISKSARAWTVGMKKVFTECLRVLKPGRTLAVNIANVLEQPKIQTNYVQIVSNIISSCQIGGDEYGWTPSVQFWFLLDQIWTKPMGAYNVNRSGHWIKSEEKPMTLYPQFLTEHILLYKKGGEYVEPENAKWQRNHFKNKKQQDEIRKDYWYFNTVPARLKEHPAVYPIELPLRVIRLYTFLGERVLDPFAGSGTTLEAAAILQREGCGFEIYPRYIEVIEDKMDQYCGIMNDFEVIRRDEM